MSDPATSRVAARFSSSLRPIAVRENENPPAPNLTPNASVKTSRVIVLCGSVYLLLLMAIFNGYPIMYPDTGPYLTSSFTFQPQIMRPIMYSLFMRFTSFGMTPWLVVIAQSAITVFVLHTVYEYLLWDYGAVERRHWVFFGLIAFLFFATSLPWYVGQLMPDVFTGLTFLVVFLLLYDPELTIEKAFLLSIVLFVSIGSHLSHFVALALFLGVILILRAIGSAREFWPRRSPKWVTSFVLVPMLASTTLVMLSNRRAGMGFTVSPGGHVYLLGRLLESGLAGDYLQQQCRTTPLTACKYLGDLPRNAEDFEWGPHPLLNEMGGWLGSKAQANEIVFGTIRRWPIRFAFECSKQMLWQFVSIKPFFAKHPFENKWELSALQQFYPGEVPRFQAAQQWTGSLQKIARLQTPVCILVFWVSTALSLLFLLKRNAKSHRANALFVLAVVFLFANALTTGALSEVINRYQSRTSWLMALCAAAYLVGKYAGRIDTSQRVED